MDQDLLHESFLLTLRNMDTEDARIRLCELFPDADPSMVRNALELAGSLLHAASSIMEKLRSGSMSESMARDELVRSCPGFSPRTYLKAWGAGLCASSW